MLKLAFKIDNREPIEHEVNSGKITIGRSQENDVRIKHSYVSAFHAEVIGNDEDGYEIVDLDSFNGTFVNGLRIDREKIAPGDELGIGLLKGKVLGLKQGWSDVAARPAKEKDSDDEASEAPASPKPKRPRVASPREPESPTRKSSDPELARLRRQISDLTEENLELSGELSQLQESQQTNPGASASPDEIQRLRDDIEEVSARAAGWKVKAESASKKASTVPDLTREVAEIKKALASEKDRVQSLSKELKEAINAVASTEKDGGQNQAALASAQNELEKAGKELSLLKAAATQIGEERDQVKQALSEASGKIGNLETLLKNQDAETSQKLAALESQMSQREKDLQEKLHSQSEAHQAELAERAAEIENRDTRISDLQSQIEKVTSELGDLRTEKVELSSQVEGSTEAATQLGELKTSLKSLESDHESALGSLDEKQRRIETLEASLEEQARDQNQLKDSIGESESQLRKELEQAQSAQAKAEAELEQREQEVSLSAEEKDQELNETRRKLEAAQQQIDELAANKAGSKEEKPDTEDLAEQLSNLQSRLDAGTAMRAQTESKLSASRKHIGELESELIELREQLEGAGRVSDDESFLTDALGSGQTSTDSNDWNGYSADGRDARIREQEEIEAENQKLEHLKAEQEATLQETKTARAVLTALRREIKKANRSVLAATA